MNFYWKAHAFYNHLGDVMWQETMFKNLWYYYSENELYVIKTLESTGIYHYAFIKARSPDQAINLFMGLKMSNHSEKPNS